MASPSKELRHYALKLGWQFLRRNGGHEIWISQTGYRMPLPSTPSSSQSVRNIQSKLRRYCSWDGRS
jgi:predicted RNA binding protein YcfA (HicA-like mRNA interferase family)